MCHLQRHVRDVDLVAAPLSEELDLRQLGQCRHRKRGGRSGAGVDLIIPIFGHDLCKKDAKANSVAWTVTAVPRLVEALHVADRFHSQIREAGQAIRKWEG